MKYLIIILVAIMLASCAIVHKTPQWDVSPTSLSKTYPDSRFIAQRGTGVDKASAEANAASQIARYFNTQVSYQFAERTLSTHTNTEIETIVNSYIQIFGVRYVHDAYVNNKQWITVAYIDRNEAWQVYQPRFRQLADAFLLLLSEAEKETDPFNRALKMLTAQNYSRSADFQNADVFGQILHPTKMNSEFANVRASTARLPQLWDSSRRNATVYMDCTDDFESMISNAFSREFNRLGFPVSNDKNTASAVCKVVVTEGRHVRDIGIFYNPSLQAIISSKTGVLWTFNIEGEKTSAVTPDVAKRRAYHSLVEKIIIVPNN